MKRFIKPVIYAFTIIAIVMFLKIDIVSMITPEKISYTEFLEKAEYGDIEKIEMYGNTIKAYPYDSDNYFLVEYIEDHDFIEAMREQEIQVENKGDKSGSALSLIGSLLLSLMPFVFIVWYLNRMFGGMGDDGEDQPSGINMLFGAGKSKGKLYKQADTGVKFSDVAGQEEAKESLTEIIDYLHNADKYSKIGAKLPKGALLIGPPGTGKTLLAKAVAGEANVPFYSITGSDFVEMFVGVGASRVRDMFAEAKKNSPCILFIDEIDAIGKSRSGSARTGGNDEREQTLNQLLSEMDGFDATTAVVVLAATNRPEILDKALTRPGRFDRRVIVDKPDLKGREDILKVHARNVNMDETVDLVAIARATAGAVGADLSNIINEAALRAVRLKRDVVSQEDLMESVELVFAGKEKKDRVMNEKERKIVAYHEVGHAVIAALQKNSEPVQKITIVPRTSGALGYTMQVPEEEKFLASKEEMISEIRTLIGGRCAEEVFFNTITTGASNDIEKVSDLAKRMITIYGMSDVFDMVAFESQESMYLDTNTFRTCSEEFSAMIDSEMIKLVKACHMEVKNMLVANQELVHEVASILLDRENITGEEFMKIFRKYHDEEYSWMPSVNISDIPDIPTRFLKPHTEALNDATVNTSLKQKNLDNGQNSSHKDKNKKDSNTHNAVNTNPNEREKTDKTESAPKRKNELEKSKPEKEKAAIQDEEKKNQPVNENDEQTNSLPDIMEDFTPPDQDVFESMVLEQMTFEGAAAEDEPPMPDFDSMFEDNHPKETVNTVNSSNEKPMEEKQKDEIHQSKEKPEAVKRPAFEAPKPKASFEAPKPLQKKKKDKGKPKQQEAPKQEAGNKNLQDKELKQEEKRDDMAILMNSFNSNPEELAQKGKKGKYINLRPPKNKNEEQGILSPESDIEQIKNSGTQSSSKDNSNTRSLNDVTEDDY